MERTFVGLGVHAWSVWAGVLDGVSGEVVVRAVPCWLGVLVEWVLALPAPVVVAYEAGPTGFGLARALEAVGVRCVVAAPSRIERAPGDRVKTDRRDAVRLVRLLRMGELVAVRVPTPVQEAARDLVRAREDARGDLMRARHRLSKLLLRHGLVWDRSTWTQAHEQWLSDHRFEQRPLQLAYEEAVAAMVSVRARRDALDRAIVWRRVSPSGVDRGSARLLTRRQYPDCVWSGRGDRRVAALQRALDRRVPGPCPERGLKRPAAQPGIHHQDRKHPRPPLAGRGRVAPPPARVAT